MDKKTTLTKMLENWCVIRGLEDGVHRREDRFYFGISLKRPNSFVIWCCWAQEDGIYVNVKMPSPKAAIGEDRLEPLRQYCNLANEDHDCMSGVFLADRGCAYFRDRYAADDEQLPDSKEISLFLLNDLMITEEFSAGIVDVLDGFSPEEALARSRKEFLARVLARHERMQNEGYGS